MADWLIVGLGNPGPEYESTRHNVGANAVLELAARHDERMKKSKELATVGEIRLAGQRVALAFPQTFMNDSGRSVQLLLKRHAIDDLGRLVVAHDELDLEPGRLKLKVGGGLAGHNGLRSLKQHLKTGEFVRLRMGVGKPPNPKAGANWVLKRPSKRDLDVLDEMIVRGADALELLVEQGLDQAMNRVNAAS